MEAQEAYRVYPVEELEKLSAQNQGEEIDQIDYNLAFVEKFQKTGEYAIFPQQGKYAILFNSEDALKQMVQSRRYPVSQETDTFFEKDKHLIENMSEGLPTLLDELFNRLEIEPLDITRCREADLVTLTDVLNKRFKEKELEPRDTYLLGFYLGNYMANLMENELEWYLEPQSTLNVHYIPLLRKKGHHWKFNFWGAIEDSLHHSGEIDLLRIMREEVALYKELEPLSNEYSNFLEKGKVGI